MKIFCTCDDYYHDSISCFDPFKLKGKNDGEKIEKPFNKNHLSSILRTTAHTTSG